MNVLSITRDYYAFCGAKNVYLLRTPDFRGEEFINAVTCLEMEIYLGASKVRVLNKETYTTVACLLSSDSKYLCVADSECNFVIIKRTELNNGKILWSSHGYFKTEKRITQINIDLDLNISGSLVLTDKSGHVFSTYLYGQQEQKLILGHCSLIVDTLVRGKCHDLLESSPMIITCDRDDKIRCSNFPRAQIIKSYLLMHKAAVVSLSLLDYNTLLSVSADGMIGKWNLVRYNLLDIVELNPLIMHTNNVTVRKVKFTKKETDGVPGVIMAVLIDGFKTIPIFWYGGENLDQLGQIEIEADEVMDLGWNGLWLTLFTPKDPTGILKVFNLEANSIRFYDIDLVYSNLESATDMKTFAERNIFKLQLSKNNVHAREQKFTITNKREAEEGPAEKKKK